MLELQTQQDMGRAKNAIQDLLIRKLLYPRVYLDGEWCGHKVDVLAIDRTGVGDVHAIKIASASPYLVPPVGGHELTMVSGASGFDQILEELKVIPGQFRYIATLLPGSRSRDYYPASRLLQATLAEDGVGRVGILFVDLGGNEPAVKLIVKPERFRSAPDVAKLADDYIATHTANWEMRE